MHKYLLIAPAALLLAACSRDGAVATAPSPSPEPVAQTAQTQAPYDRPMTAQPAQAPNMYPEPQTANRASSNPPVYRPQTPNGQAGYAQLSGSADRQVSEPSAAPLTAYGQPAYNRTVPATNQPAYNQPVPSPSQPAYDQPTGEPPYTEPVNPPNWVAEAPRGRTFDGPMIPAGTTLHVRLDESLGTRHDRSGERFYATLAAPVVEDGRTMLPAGTRFIGHLTESKPSGRLKGRAVLAVRLDAFDWHGRQYDIATSSIGYASRNHKRHNLEWIGGGTGVGAAIGAIAGGGGGALIGAAAGAGAGTAGAIITGKKQVRLGAETPLTFRLRYPIQM